MFFIFNIFFIQLFTLGEARLLLKKDDAVVKAVFEYWKSKRLKVVSVLIALFITTILNV